MWIVSILMMIGVILFIQFQNKTKINLNHPNIEYLYNIVGEQSCQQNLKTIAGAKQAESKYFQTSAKVISEPDNKFDRNAIKVEIDGLLVGYISKQDAEKLAGRKVNKVVPCLINGGWLDAESEGSYGVKLAIQNLNDLL